MTHLHTYEVEGRGYFPVDMLRYDASWPARSEDAVALTQHNVMGDGGFRTVRLIHKGLKSWEPTWERWRSFGWQKVSHEKAVIR